MHSIGGSDRDTISQHMRDHADLVAEHTHPAIPATCGGCGALVHLVLWPTIRKLERGITHICYDSVAGQRRLLAIEDEGRRTDRQVAARRKRALR